MARIAGIDLPREKRIEIGLTYIYGIGRTSAKKILEMAQINPDIHVKDLNEDQESALREAPDRDRLLSRHPAPPWSARSWPENQDQRPYTQGPEEDHCE